ncbi:MAG: hypothetical protein ACLSIL_13390 [Enterococcus casseliflavus]
MTWFYYPSSPLGASQQDAEDIAQEAVVKILEIDSVLSAEAIRPWLFRGYQWLLYVV